MESFAEFKQGLQGMNVDEDKIMKEVNLDQKVEEERGQKEDFLKEDEEIVELPDMVKMEKEMLKPERKKDVNYLKLFEDENMNDKSEV